jgi:hypothetical protein
VERAFSGYEDLAAWLQEQGYQITESSVQRYGSRFQQKLELLEQSAHQAKALAAATSQGRALVVDATIDLLNERVFSALIEAEQISQDDLARLSRTVADLSRTSISRQRWAEEAKIRLREARERRAKGTIDDATYAIRGAIAAIKAFTARVAKTPAVDRGLTPKSAPEGFDAAKLATHRPESG